MTRHIAYTEKTRFVFTIKACGSLRSNVQNGQVTSVIEKQKEYIINSVEKHHGKKRNTCMNESFWI